MPRHASVHVVRFGTKRVAVGWWSNGDGRECHGDYWAPTCCFGTANGAEGAVRWEGMVEASLMNYSDGRWRVCVWGGDDFGMARDTDDEHIARCLFDRVNHLVTIADLRSWGFEPA